jgi:hypothetical protein
MSEKKDNPGQSDSHGTADADLLNSSKHSFEVTGLGIIASLIISSWPLVVDGTLGISNYCVFVAFLLVGAAGMAWRLIKLQQPQRTSRPR